MTALVGDKVGAPPDFEPTGESHELPADLVLIAIGFTGVERGAASTSSASPSASAARSPSTGFATTADGVFACGDARRGQSLIVTAIAEGRQCARRRRALPHRRVGSMPWSSTTY